MQVKVKLVAIDERFGCGGYQIYEKLRIEEVMTEDSSAVAFRIDVWIRDPELMGKYIVGQQLTMTLE